MQDKSLIRNLIKGIRKRLGSFFNNPYRDVNLGWYKIKLYKHLPAGKTRKHRMAGGVICFNNSREFLHGIDEIFIQKIYLQDLPEKALIIDCGANIGLSVIYLKKICPSARILAFEPDEHNFELLKSNVSSYGFADVELRKEAVWTANTELHFSNEASMSSRIESTGTSTTMMVKATRLRDLLDQKIDFLKIDIEGAEYDVIKDCNDKLNMVNNLFVEYHGRFDQNNELSELLGIISGNGFSYYIKEATPVYKTPLKRNKQTITPFDVQLNIFCFRNNKRNEPVRKLV